ncbi:MAG: glycosyltransferase family 2 protein [Prevotellaceae bacterium]|jgi:glycosyltransferase involved in cell wall biosynthesis|nr:glycosyltransferase family 2 protein [Prevotellaceae bacterium]
MKPKLICLTPVRNEAWALDAFLTATSLWADHIIVADQNSTDGSREIYKKYPKVKMIENDGSELDENYRMNILYAEARKIEGEKALFMLDADEIFTANYSETADWQKIINAKAGDIFQFHWAELNSDATCYNEPNFWYQWAFYDDGTMPVAGKIHVARVPWPQNSTPNEIFVTDFKVMHLPYLNTERVKSKSRFYQCYIWLYQNTAKPIKAVQLYRGYANPEKFEPNTPVPDCFFANYKAQNIDLLKLIDFSKTFCWQDEQVLEYFKQKGTKYFSKLDIWDKTWLENLSKIAGKEISDPRNIFDKLLHFYLRKTQKYSKIKIVRGIDKILKKII